MSTRPSLSIAVSRDQTLSPSADAYAAVCPSSRTVFPCGLLLVAIKLSLVLCGFARTRRVIEALTRRTHTRCSSIGARVAELDRRVALASALYPGRALCLEQSLALHALLRREGIPSCFRLGVQPHPFAAHAWIEVDGVPVNDVVEHVRHFTPFPDIAP